MALTQVASGLIASVSGASLTGTQTIPRGTLPTGSVLQVVQGTYATIQSTSSTSFVDTNLTASITPSSSASKVLVFVNLNGCLSLNSLSSSLQCTLVRGSTSICNFADAGLTNFASRNDFGDCAVTYLDSPATTSSTTYKVQGRSSNGGTVYWCNQSGIAVSTITLMEISA